MNFYKFLIDQNIKFNCYKINIKSANIYSRLAHDVFHVVEVMRRAYHNRHSFLNQIFSAVGHTPTSLPIYTSTINWHVKFRGETAHKAHRRVIWFSWSLSYITQTHKSSLRTFVWLCTNASLTTSSPFTWPWIWLAGLSWLLRRGRNVEGVIEFANTWVSFLFRFLPLSTPPQSNDSMPLVSSLSKLSVFHDHVLSCFSMHLLFVTNDIGGGWWGEVDRNIRVWGDWSV